MIAMKGSNMSKDRTFLTIAVVAAMVAAGGLGHWRYRGDFIFYESNFNEHSVVE